MSFPGWELYALQQATDTTPEQDPLQHRRRAISLTVAAAIVNKECNDSDKDPDFDPTGCVDRQDSLEYRATPVKVGPRPEHEKSKVPRSVVPPVNLSSLPDRTSVHTAERLRRLSNNTWDENTP